MVPDNICSSFLISNCHQITCTTIKLHALSLAFHRLRVQCEQPALFCFCLVDRSHRRSSLRIYRAVGRCRKFIVLYDHVTMTMAAIVRGSLLRPCAWMHNGCGHRAACADKLKADMSMIAQFHSSYFLPSLKT